VTFAGRDAKIRGRPTALACFSTALRCAIRDGGAAATGEPLLPAAAAAMATAALALSADTLSKSDDDDETAESLIV